MKLWQKWAVAGLVMTLLAAGSLRTLSARSTKQAALEAQQLTQKTEVSIDLMPSDLVEIRVREMPQSVAISGEIKAINTAFVKARVAGELQGLVAREGDRVQAGQILAHIDPTESSARLSQARQQAQAAKAQVDIAQRAFDNNRALVAQGFVSSTALETAQANLTAAQSSFAAAQSSVSVAAKTMDDTVLRAPISGLIAQRLAQTGERVSVDARVVEIVDLSRLELEAALNSSDALQVKIGQTVQLRADGVTQAFAARVVRINPSVTVGSRAVKVYLAVESATSLRQGQFVQGSLLTGSRSALAVPLTAVRTDKPQPYLQTVQQNQVQHLPVALGERSEVDQQTLVAITGVPEGTQAIGGAVGSLRAGTLIRLGQNINGSR